MIFGFTVLTLTLFAVALLFAYLHAKSQFTNALKARDRRLARDMKAMRKRFAGVNGEIDKTNATLAEVSRLVSTGKTVPAVGTITPFSRMEDRYEQQRPNVMVNETPVTAARK